MTNPKVRMTTHAHQRLRSRLPGVAPSWLIAEAEAALAEHRTCRKAPRWADRITIAGDARCVRTHHDGDDIAIIIATDHDRRHPNRWAIVTILVRRQTINNAGTAGERRCHRKWRERREAMRGKRPA